MGREELDVHNPDQRPLLYESVLYFTPSSTGWRRQHDSEAHPTPGRPRLAGVRLGEIQNFIHVLEVCTIPDVQAGGATYE